MSEVFCFKGKDSVLDVKIGDIVKAKGKILVNYKQTGLTVEIPTIIKSPFVHIENKEKTTSSNMGVY